MRKLSILFISLAVLACLGRAQFVGAGVNTHGQFLPVGKLKAIGIRWVRADWPATGPEAPKMEARVKAILKWYKPLPVLWILDQKAPDPGRLAKQLVSWGIRDMEVGNEPDIRHYNPGLLVWRIDTYADFFRRIRKAVGTRARLWGPACSWFDPDYIGGAKQWGMLPDGITYHGYGSKDLAEDYDLAAKLWQLPVVVSEVGQDGADGQTPEGAALWFLATQMKMGDRPWCYYDGPDTDWRGLFRWNGANYDTPTEVYNRIKAGSLTRAIKP